MINQNSATYLKYLKITAFFVLMAMPILFYYSKVWRHAYNFPYSDDYAAVLGFMNQFHAGNTSQRFWLMFEQHNEHRILFDKIVFLVQYYSMGEVNFTVLIWLGNLGLLLAVFILYYISRTLKNPVLFFIPIVFLIFHLQHWENMAFAMAALSNFYVGIFAILSLYLLSLTESKVFFIISFILGALTVFTAGNGLFVFPVGILFLLLQKKINVFRLLTWTLTGVLSIGFYFMNYRGNSGLTKHIIQHPYDILSGFVGAVGNFANIADHWEIDNLGFLIGVIVGYFISVFILFLIYKKFYFQNPLLFCLILFFLMSIGAMSLVRTMDFTPRYISSASRYDISSVFLAVFCYLSILELFKNHEVQDSSKPMKAQSLFLVPIFWSLFLMSMYLNYKSNQTVILNAHTRNVLKGCYYWRKEGKTEFLLTTPDYGKQVLNEAAQKRLYTPPNYDRAYLYYDKLLKP